MPVLLLLLHLKAEKGRVLEVSPLFFVQAKLEAQRA